MPHIHDMNYYGDGLHDESCYFCQSGARLTWAATMRVITYGLIVLLLNPGTILVAVLILSGGF